MSNPDLASYQAWLRRRGTSEGSIEQYSFQVTRLLEGEDPVTRVADKKLSPKYRRLLKAAATSHARFSGDEALIEQLSSIKLPAPVRRRVQMPLTERAWKNLRVAISDSPLRPPMRAVLGVMACRGLRSGDVLRLRRSEITGALKKGVLSYVAKGDRRLEFGVGPSWRRCLEIFAESFSGLGNKQVVDLVVPHSPERTKTKSASAAVVRSLRRTADGVDLDGYDLDDLHPHVLRRTVATLMYTALGNDPAKLTAWMQWASVTTAMGYVDHAHREELDAVADKLLAE